MRSCCLQCGTSFASGFQRSSSRGIVSVSDHQAALLKKAGEEQDLSQGRRLHTILAENGADRGTFLGNCLVRMYGSCGSPQQALEAFARISSRNVYSWNILITAVAQNGDPLSARALFTKMPYHDQISWNTLLAAFARAGELDQTLKVFAWMELRLVPPSRLTFVTLLEAFGALDRRSLEQGELLHRKIAQSGLQSDLQIQTGLIRMYDRCGDVPGAVQEFYRIIRPDLMALNAMLSAYSRNGFLDQATDFFRRMQERNPITWNIFMSANVQHGSPSFALKIFLLMDLEGGRADRAILLTALLACCALADFRMGKLVHVEVSIAKLESDVVFGSALISLYGNCGYITDARYVFENIENRSQVAWNSMLTAFAQNGEIDKVSKVLVLMPSVDAISCTVVLAEYGELGHLRQARELFDRILFKDIASWSVMISAYARNGRNTDALLSLAEMDQDGFHPEKVTLLAILEARLTRLEARVVEDLVKSSGLILDNAVVTALVSMHGKCGRLADAQGEFDEAREKNVILWTALIGAYGQNGYGETALELFHLMNLEGVRPNEVTLVNILSACSHGGLVRDCVQLFQSVEQDFGLRHTRDHHMCVGDLLGRCGEFEQAQELVSSMPFVADCSSWMTLLAACKVHGNVSAAAEAAKRASAAARPGHRSPYIMLSNIYAEAGMTDEAGKVRNIMRETNEFN